MSVPVAEAALTETAMIDTVQRLIECESPSSDHAAVARSADLVAALGTQLLGVAPERIDVDGVAHLRWQFGASTRVLLLAHHDTVWPIGTLDRLPFAIDDGLLAGPGCFDMKTGLAMALHAVSQIDDRDGITILVTGDEEVGSVRSRALIEETAAGARATLVLEASADGGALKGERKGVSLYEVAVSGRAAHAGLEPEKGINASIELAHLTLAAAALTDTGAGTSVTPTVASSGSTTNTVPARALLSIDVRARTADELERVDAALRAYDPVTPGAAIEVRGGINRPPLESRMSASLFARAARLAERCGLAPLECVAVGGASDGNFTAGLGVPTLDGLGAVGGGAHAENEHALIREIVPRTRLLIDLITDISRTEEPWHN